MRMSTLSTKRKSGRRFEMESSAEILVSTRISRSLHAKIVKRQKEIKKQTGIEPKIGSILRAMLEEAAEMRARKQ